MTNHDVSLSGSLLTFMFGRNVALFSQMDATTVPGARTRCRLGRVAARAFFVSYLTLQLSIPLLGLSARISGDVEVSNFSWHMFSALVDRDET
jgi:hypothetical protein